MECYGILWMIRLKSCPWFVTFLISHKRCGRQHFCLQLQSGSFAAMDLLPGLLPFRMWNPIYASGNGTDLTDAIDPREFRQLLLERLRHVYNVWVDKGSVARINARRKRGKTNQISESLTWFQISLRRSRWQCSAIAVAHVGASWTIPQMRTFWKRKDEKAKLPLYGLSLGISSLMPWFCSFTLVTFSAVHWISRLQRKDRLGDGVWARSDTVYTVGRAVGNKHLLSSQSTSAMSPGKDSRKALRKRPLSLVPSWMKL